MFTRSDGDSVFSRTEIKLFILTVCIQKINYQSMPDIKQDKIFTLDLMVFSFLDEIAHYSLSGVFTFCLSRSYDDCIKNLQDLRFSFKCHNRVGSN